jgi:hypothetical protein
VLKLSFPKDSRFSGGDGCDTQFIRNIGLAFGKKQRVRNHILHWMLPASVRMDMVTRLQAGQPGCDLGYGQCDLSSSQHPNRF